MDERCKTMCCKYLRTPPLSCNGRTRHCDVWKIQQAGSAVGLLLREENPLLWRGRKAQEIRGTLNGRTTSVKPPVFAGRFSPTYFCPFCLANMACGATLKRSMEFEALLSPQSPKRRRCNPLPGTSSTPSPQRCNLRPPVDSPTHSMSPPAIGGEHRLTPGTKWKQIWRLFPAFQGGCHGGGGLGGVEWIAS